MTIHTDQNRASNTIENTPQDSSNTLPRRQSSEWSDISEQTSIPFTARVNIEILLDLVDDVKIIHRRLQIAEARDVESQSNTPLDIDVALVRLLEHGRGNAHRWLQMVWIQRCKAGKSSSFNAEGNLDPLWSTRNGGDSPLQQYPDTLPGNLDFNPPDYSVLPDQEPAAPSNMRMITSEDTCEVLMRSEEQAAGTHHLSIDMDVKWKSQNVAHLRISMLILVLAISYHMLIASLIVVSAAIIIASPMAVPAGTGTLEEFQTDYSWDKALQRAFIWRMRLYEVSLWTSIVIIIMCIGTWSDLVHHRSIYFSYVFVLLIATIPYITSVERIPSGTTCWTLAIGFIAPLLCLSWLRPESSASIINAMIRRLKETLQNAGIAASSLFNTDLALLLLYRSIWNMRERAKHFLRPRIAPGYTRMEWRCTCGEKLYGDFQATTLAHIEQLVGAPRGSSQVLGTANETANEQSSAASAGNSNYRNRHERAGVGWTAPGNISRNNVDHHSTSSMSLPGDLGVATSRQRQSPDPPTTSVLQLCAAVSRYSSKLNLVETTCIQSDGTLFEDLRRAYQRMRGSRLPDFLRLRKPDQALFVKFRMISEPLVSVEGGTILAPAIPPESEVHAKRYRYTPCPIDDTPMTSNVFMHYFTRPAEVHPKVQWGPRLPSNLGKVPSSMQHGWGVMIVERPDWALFAALMSILVLLSGLVAGIYGWKTGDSATGVAIGAWLTTIQTLAATSMFFWWI